MKSVYSIDIYEKEWITRHHGYNISTFFYTKICYCGILIDEIRNNFSIHFDPCNEDLNIYSRRGCIYADLHTHAQM